LCPTKRLRRKRKEEMRRGSKIVIVLRNISEREREWEERGEEKSVTNDMMGVN